MSLNKSLANGSGNEIGSIVNGMGAKFDPEAMPGMIPKINKGTKASGLRIRYGKYDIDNLADLAELERIETKALRDEGVYVLSKKDFLFMDKVFILINYIEVAD